MDELVRTDVLHPQCRQIFQNKRPGQSPQPLRLHQHQTDAIQAARSGESYVLSTGTGSGKSLAYIIPIVDSILRLGSGRGIQAIIIYPMNALANSQMGELEKFIGKESPLVRFARYTGQEDEQTRTAIVLHPPDILLTNYVMMELLLTRTFERDIIEKAQGLRYLVLDELHTYRGRQGSDVAMLVRRVREACHAPQLQCVGTSATLSTGGAFTDQQSEIAGLASRLFGTPVRPERIIGETLRRMTDAGRATDPTGLRQSVLAGGATESDATAFLADPLASWIESTFGLAEEPESGRLRRAASLVSRALPASWPA